MLNEDQNILKIYLKEINSVPLLSPHEEAELVVKAQQGDLVARERLLKSHLRFVVTVAKKYQGQGLPLIDLISEGNIGLITALDKFDVSRGYHFISYAVWWIRQSILKAINEKSRMIRLPMNLINHLVQIEKVKENYQIEGNFEEVVDQVADILAIEKEKVKTVLEMSKDPISLETPIDSKREAVELMELVEDKKYIQPDEVILEEGMREDLHQALSQLTEKEARVLEYRYGLKGNHPMSLKEIADIFNLTKERIRQIEMRAISRLRENSAEILRTYVA